MEILSQSPQAATVSSGTSSASQPERRGGLSSEEPKISSKGQKVPSEGQKVPSASQTKVLKESENKEAKIEVTQENLQKAVDSLNTQANTFNRNLQFSVDSDLDRTVIRVVDTDTKQVIRQIPSEEVLSIAKRAEASASALLDVVA